MSERELTVKAITLLTGLNEHTLRAWERRYGAVKPRRLANGRRLYNEADVERLRKMVQLVERGYPIGRIARLADGELAVLLSRALEMSDVPSAGESGLVATTRRAVEIGAAVAAVERSLERYDLAAIYEEISRARYRFGAKAFALELVLPLMSKVGRLIVEGRFSVAQEHALTAVLKAQLFEMLFALRKPTFERRGKRSVAIATMEGDLHELGILVSAVLCADHGIGCVYLGPNMPPAPLGEAITALGSQILIVGLSPLPPGTLPRSPERFLALLSAALPAGTELWLGGRVDVDLGGAKVRQAVSVIRSLEELDRMLEREASHGSHGV